MTNREDGGMNVLIADDEDSIRFVLREALEIEGHLVNEVADGDSALNLSLIHI